ncbi:MAG: hypothetical protein Q8P41_07905 [Pseudomonadota bacterium]|nr:hypothetical protein [Pseudomonadota bacterium]
MSGDPAGSARHARFAEGLLLLYFVALPLSTAAQEVILAVALLYAATRPTRARLGAEPWGRAALAVAAVWVLLSGASGNLHEGLGHAWLLAPLLVVPALVQDDAQRARITRAGLLAAGIAATWAIGQRVTGAVGTAGLSHHLSLAYALLVPLGVALAQPGRWRWALAGLLGAGVLATGSAGAHVALVVTVGASFTRRPGTALLVGAVATLLLLGLADPEELRQRAILWTGGLTVAEAGAVGPGGYAAASAPAYDVLAPGFWFPNHAHDSGIQVLAVLGPAGLVATLGLLTLGLRHGAIGPAAGLAGVLVGAMTQDVLGDLEVARAAWAWLALFGGAAAHLPQRTETHAPHATPATSGNPTADADTETPW